MDWISLVGPAVVAAVISGLVSGIGIWISARTARRIHAEKLTFDREQTERRFVQEVGISEAKFRADTALAEKKLALDRELTAWKRRQDLAEEVLSSFYQMVDTIRAIRSPMSYAGEGKDRQKAPGESPEVSRIRDTYYAIVERFEARRKEMADLLARRYRMTAWFGKEADKPFELVYGALSQIIVSARLLIDWADENFQSLNPDNARLWTKMRGDIWEGAATPDPIGDQVKQAIVLIEQVCRPVLQEQSK